MIIEQMARELGLSVAFVHSIAYAASYEYKTYTIPKRTTGVRVIHHPSKRLKALQRWLLVNAIEKLPFHPRAMAYRKNHSIFQNASAHVDSRYLLRMDLENFFPSITQVDIAKYIADHPAFFHEWTPLDIDTFCKLVCRNMALTIGAPTSPAISNAICFDMDSQLDAMSVGNQVIYTRYADDLFFSANLPGILRPIEEAVAGVISALKVPSGLKINREKTRHSSKRGIRRITGIVLGSDRHAYVGRKLKRRIRALIHKYDSLSDSSQASLAGLIAYVTGFDPQFMNSLITKYGLPKVRKAMGHQGLKEAIPT